MTILSTSTPTSTRANNPSQPGRSAVVIHVDGASSGNPGPAAVGVVLRVVPETALAEVGEGIGEATSNEAEYRAILRGIQEAQERGFRHVRMYSDSQLAVRQINGEWACNQPHLSRLRGDVQAAGGLFDSFSLVWIARTKNTRADALATNALDEILGRDGKTEFTFHNFERLRAENVRLREELQRLREANPPLQESDSILQKADSVQKAEAAAR